MSASTAKPFTLNEPSIEEIAKRLAGIYAQVSLSRDPIFSWLEIMNDVTILGEDLRRGRDEEAVDRAATVLARLLEGTSNNHVFETFYRSNLLSYNRFTSRKVYF